MAELVYALVLGTSSSRIEGSSPSLPTSKIKLHESGVLFLWVRETARRQFRWDLEKLCDVFERLKIVKKPQRSTDCVTVESLLAHLIENNLTFVGLFLFYI